jgi:hypothetical protein
MTTRDFIAKTYGVESSRDRQCSSVFADMKGNIYSYGYHYPLLFKVCGKWYVNTAGYSVTTAKHIGWAWSACDYNAIGVELNRDDVQTIARTYLDDEIKLTTIKGALARQIGGIKAEMASKKRKDTMVYKFLELDLEKVQDYALEVDA